MVTRGFSKAGLARLRDSMAAHVNAGRVPGMVYALSRGDEIHVEAVGTAEVGSDRPMQPDTIFRITSMTRPITAAATLLLVADGRLALDQPVDAMLPELADRRVLRGLDGPVDDTVPADRPITVRDLLTFRGGFGMILAPPSEYPVLMAEQALRLSSAGPPVPVTPHRPDEWMRRMGTLPLMDQPGTQWRYNSGSQILGVLVGRASGQPLESFYKERVFAPLGMNDTAFEAPTSRLAACYQEVDGALVPFDDEGAWSGPRVFADGGAGAVSTARDYLAFGRMLLHGGTHEGRQILPPDLVAAMTSNQLTEEQRATAGPILNGRGWGFGVSIIGPPEVPDGLAGYGWDGGFGTTWRNHPDEDLVGVLCTQVLSSTGSSPAAPDFWSGTYAALEA
jgi:CubicO group peptidase (beta-lactamase class C family)